MFSGAFNGILKVLVKNYTSEQLEEMQLVRNIFQMHIGEFQGIHPTTLTADDDLPEFFWFDEQEKYPRVTQNRDYRPNVSSYYWEQKLSGSLLDPEISDMINHIIFCQVSMSAKKNFYELNFSFNPMNLVFEELKAWLIELSKVQSINNQTRDVVRVRLNYLRALFDNHSLYQSLNSNVKNTIRCTISNLMQIVDNNLFDIINTSISRLAARDILSELRKTLRYLLKTNVKFLFYVFRSGDKVPASFILSELAYATYKPYQRIHNTATGKLINALLQSPLFLEVFPNDYLSNDSIPEYSLSIDVNDLIKFNFKTTPPDVNSYLLNDMLGVFSLNNAWYRSDSNPSGVLEPFAERDLMSHFLHLHELTEKLCLFYVICEYAYELAGEGGNILLFKLLAENLKEALASYKQHALVQRRVLKHLFKVAEDYHKELAQQASKQKIPKESRMWDLRFPLLRQAYQQTEEQFHEISTYMDKLELLVRSVSHESYQRILEEKIYFFQACIHQYSSLFIKTIPQTDTLQENIPVLSSTIEFVEDTNSSISEEPMALEDVIEFYSIGKYDTALDEFLSIAASNSVTQEIRCQAYAFCADIFRMQGELNHAKDYIGFALKYNQQRMDYYQLKMTIETQIAYQETSAAIEDIRALLQKVPRSSMQGQNLSEQLKNLKKSLRYLPDFSDQSLLIENSSINKKNN